MAAVSQMKRTYMVTRSAILSVTCLVLLVLAWATPTMTQTPAPEPALLTEVRLLRQAIEALAGNGSRIQLVFGRLQLQEQRTTAAASRVTAARSALASHMVSLSAVNNRIVELESSRASGSAPPEEARAIEDSLAHYRRESGRLEAERVRLANEETDAAQGLNAEQGRWSDLNRQVEELERVLVQRR
jgi:hypothetical protein